MHERNLLNNPGQIPLQFHPNQSRYQGILTSAICSALLNTGLVTIRLHCEIPRVRLGINNASRL